MQGSLCSCLQATTIGLEASCFIRVVNFWSRLATTRLCGFGICATSVAWRRWRLTSTSARLSVSTIRTNKYKKTKCRELYDFSNWFFRFSQISSLRNLWERRPDCESVGVSLKWRESGELSVCHVLVLSNKIWFLCKRLRFCSFFVCFLHGVRKVMVLYLIFFLKRSCE